MNKCFLLIVVLFSTTLRAEWDFKAEQLFRSFPTGFYLKANGGYSYKFWKGDKKFLYGYIRPAINLQTSAVVNVGTAHLDFNPISFVNIFMGASHTNRNLSEISNFNCEVVVCRGKLNRKYYGSRIAFSLSNFTLMMGIRWTRVSIQNPINKPFADELSSTVASAGNDLLTQKTLLLGKNLNEKLMIGYLGQYNRMRNLKNSSSMHILINRYAFSKSWHLSAGPGVFKTRTGASNLTLLSLLTWNFKGAPILAN